MPAGTMTPDIPTTGIPVVASNTTTGEQVFFDMSEDLRAAVDAAIAARVAGHPAVGAAVGVVRSRERADRTVMQSSLIDVGVALVAALVTIVSPDSDLVGVLWLAAAVLASRTMLTAAIERMVPEVTP